MITRTNPFGKKVTSSTMPAGGRGVIGWLSAIWDKLNGTLTVTGTITATPSGTQDVNIVSSVEIEVKNDAGNPIPISATALPLPTGASTEVTLTQVRDYLDTVETQLASLLTNTTGLNLETTQIQVRDYLDTVEIKLQTIITNLGSPFQAGGNIGNTAFIANAGIDLNTSALNLEATQQLLLTALNDIKTYTDSIETLIGTSNTKLTSIDGKDFATQATLALIKAKTDNLDVALSTRASALIQTDRSQKTQITDGTNDATVKAASTLPVAADKALVVTLRDPLTITDSNLKNKIGATATLANVAASITSVTLIASNVNAIARHIYNDSASVCYIKYGSTASATSFVEKLYPEESLDVDNYNGIITGIWTIATGNARTTEITL